MTPSHRLALVIGFTQTLAYATTYYLPSIALGAVAADLQATPTMLLGGFSWALLVNGLSAPRIGRWIERFGGRGVLASGSVVIGLGLVTMAAFPSLPGWYAAWTLLGIGMALGLYDAAFATIGRLLGAGSRPTIVGVTMLGGLASSIGWSMGWLVDLVGWQGTALIYAAINLGVNLPLELWLIPRALPLPPPVTDIRVAAAARPAAMLGVFVPLAIFFSLRAAITTIFSVHALWLMQGIGLSAAAAVGALALIGPSQVGIRIVEWFLGRRTSPMTTSLLGAGALPVAVGWLLLGGPAAAFAVVWGISNGILTISRCLLPMYLFGARGYATRLGQLALPALLTQAAAPTLIAPLVAAWPAGRVLGVLGIAGIVALLCLLPLCRVRAAAQDD